MNKKPLVLLALRYGAVAAIMLVAVFFAFSFFETDPIHATIIPAMILLFMFIFSAVREYKTNIRKGYLMIWEGISIGFIVYISVALVASLSLFGVTNYEPKYLSNYIENNEKSWAENKDKIIEENSVEYYDNYIKDLRKTTPSWLLLGSFMGLIGVGILLTFIVSVILRKQPPV